MKAMRKMVGPIIWIIVISSAMWSIQGVFTGLSGQARGVGRAFGKVVSFKEFDDAYKSTQLLSHRQDGGAPDADELREATWQHIIFNREAAKEKITVNDAEVVAEIDKLTGGQTLSPQAYDDLIRRNFNEQPRNFEERIRTILKIRKLYSKHQNADTSATDSEARQFFVNDQSKISVNYVQLKSEDEAKKFKEQVNSMDLWNAERAKEDRKIVSLGPVNLDIFMTVLGLSQANIDSLMKLTPSDLSEIFSTKTGYAIFNVTKKELVSADSMDQTKLEEYKKRLGEQKKQTAFYDWMNGVVKRAAIEKFKTAP